MSADRHAALALHALGATDREWLLGQLSTPHRARIESLLQELQGLGIPQDSALVKHAAPVPAPEPIPEPPPSTPAERVRAARPDEMLQLLSKEPCRLITSVLAIEPYPWVAAFLRGLGSQRRAAVKDGMHNPVAPRMATELIHELDVRLSALRAEPAPVSVVVRWRARVTQFLRKAASRWKK